MSVSALSTRPVLADAVLPRRRVATDIALIAAGVAVVAALAQVTIPLPIVPITGQTLGVILVGAALGSRRGAASLASYMVAGLAGAPIFAEAAGGPGMLTAPSFGYIIGFIPAAFVAGWMAERAWDRKFGLATLGFIAASVLPFLTGVPYMAWVLNSLMGAGMDFNAIMEAGVYPFIAGGVVKAAIAGALIPGAWAFVRRLDRGK